MSTPEVALAVTPARKSRFRKPLVLGAALGVAVAVGGFAAWSAGLLPALGGGAGADEHTPKLQLAEASSPAQPRYVTSYHRLDGAFTTNLAASPRFVQVELGVATRYDARVIERVGRHELPIRSAVLAILAQTPEAAVATPAGRLALQRRLRDAINAVLVDKEGFGGVDDVYFAGLIVQ